MGEQQTVALLRGEYGYHAGRASYFIADTPAASKAVFERLRGEGYPTSIGPLAVESVRDLGTGGVVVQTSTQSFLHSLDLIKAQLVLLRCSRARIIIMRSYIGGER